MKLKSSFLILSLLFISVKESNAQVIKAVDSLAKYQPGKFVGFDSTFISKYPTVDFDLNYFQFYSTNSPNWEYLYDKMQSMIDQRSEKMNFYHIGGSHIQADIYTHDIRQKMQTTWQKLPGERAWVFPFDLARTNNPWNYEFKSSSYWERYRSVVSSQKDHDYGVLGAKITCADSIMNLSFKYDKTDVKSTFTKIRIFHNKGSLPFNFSWGSDETLWWTQSTDSIVGYTEIVFAKPIVSFDLQVERCVKEGLPFELYGFQLLNDLPGISYSSVGINGAGLYTYLDCKSFEEQLKTLPPDLFSFSVGTNDGNVPYSSFDPQIYKANLEKMMLIVLRANPKCAILLTVPNDSYYHKTQLNRNIERERTVIRELAAEYKVPVWDFYGIMGELGSSKIWYRNKLMRSDLVHFSPEGYHLKGDLYFDAFQKFMVQFDKRRLESSKNDMRGEY
jgi:lysophospholipase L1-like esterase